MVRGPYDDVKATDVERRYEFGMISPRELAPHERLLVKSIQRTDVREPFDEDETAMLQEESSRQRLVRLAMRHGVHGLFVSSLLGSAVMGSLSPDVVHDFTVSWARLRRQAALWNLERDRLLSLLDRKSFTPVVLKGGALRETVYQDPADRAMGDLDVLLPADQIEPALHALEGVGYRSPGSEKALDAHRRHDYHFVLTHPNGFVVELHWALSRASHGFHLDERAFLARAVKAHASGRVLRIPSAEDMILHMAEQNEDDGFALLRRLVDLDRIVAATPGLDWDYVREAARQARLEGYTALALRIAQLVLLTPVPAGFIGSLGVSAVCRVNLALLRPIPWVITRHGDRYAAAAEVMLFWTTVGWRNRLRRYAAIALARKHPLAWLWGHRPPERWRRVRGLSAIGKLAAYQLAVYSSALAACVTAAGRRRLRFWRDGAGRSTLPPGPLR
jgi:hypothetical protein